MADKPTTVTNSLLLDYPRDEYGITTLVRKEAVRAIGRLGGNDEKLAVFLGTLRVLAKYAQDKLAVQKTIREADFLTAEQVAADEAERRQADQARELARIDNEIARLTAQREAHVPAEPEAPAE